MEDIKGTAVFFDCVMETNSTTTGQAKEDYGTSSVVEINQAMRLVLEFQLECLNASILKEIGGLRDELKEVREDLPFIYFPFTTGKCEPMEMNKRIHAYETLLFEEAKHWMALILKTYGGNDQPRKLTFHVEQLLGDQDGSEAPNMLKGIREDIDDAKWWSGPPITAATFRDTP